MNWIDEHLGSVEYFGDFYVPRSGSGGGDGGNKKQHTPGNEQIRSKQDCSPRVVKTRDYDYPRLQKFFDLEQFLNYVDWQGQNWRRSSQKTDREKYRSTMTWSFQEAMHLARYGWFEGLNEIKNLKKIRFPAREYLEQNYDFQTIYSVTGGSVNIERYLSNVPNCMRHMHVSAKHSLPARIQKILIIGDYHAKINTSDIIAHGYEVYQIIEALEMVNVQTEITIAFSNNQGEMWASNDYDFYEVYIKIKNTQDIMYPEKLLFCVAHPAMLRRLVFSEQEKNPFLIRQKFHFHSTNSGNYGLICPNGDHQNI